MNVLPRHRWNFFNLANAFSFPAASYFNLSLDSIAEL